jgi:hypothetical protein
MESRQKSLFGFHVIVTLHCWVIFLNWWPHTIQVSKKHTFFPFFPYGKCIIHISNSHSCTLGFTEDDSMAICSKNSMYNASNLRSLSFFCISPSVVTALTKICSFYVYTAPTCELKETLHWSLRRTLSPLKLIQIAILFVMSLICIASICVTTYCSGGIPLLLAILFCLPVDAQCAPH